MRITRVLTFAEYVQMNRDARAKGFYHGDRRVFTPGMAWPMPWYFDPLGELSAFVQSNAAEGYRDDPMIAGPDAPGADFLSIHYWRDWAAKRAPICVVCPNGEQWEIDRKSSNGDGWTVLGDLPDITCHPSIVVDGYHGWLKGGEFSADTEGRGENGIAREI